MKTYFAQKIEEWYALYGRKLPWRETNDPYQIWVSEIILQQTRVVQGMDYFVRFIERFPDVKSLSRAEEDEVLRLWQGLGYYSRARNMHKAAKQIQERSGIFPDTYEEIRSLAGIGDYTASAIMSFAYGKPYAVVDGNVYRILARTQGIDLPIDSTQGKKLFGAMAQELLDKQSPALYNQAIMDFGALQCTPKGCDCTICPLIEICTARKEGRVDELPVKVHKTSVRERHLIYINIKDKHGNMLLHKRGKGDIWESLYELPCMENGIPDELWLKTMIEEGGELTLRKKGVKHQLTHQLLIADLYELSVPFNLEDWMKNNEDLMRKTEYQCIHELYKEKYAMPRLVHSLLS